MDEEQGGWGGEAPAPVTAGAPVGDAAPPPGRGLADLGELAFAGLRVLDLVGLRAYGPLGASPLPPDPD